MVKNERQHDDHVNAHQNGMYISVPHTYKPNVPPACLKGGQRMDRLISFISKCMRLSLTFVYHMASPALHLHRRRNLNATYRNREFPLLRNADPGKPRKRGGAAEQSRSSNVPSKPRHAMQERSAVRKKESLHGRRKHVN